MGIVVSNITLVNGFLLWLFKNGKELIGLTVRLNRMIGFSVCCFIDKYSNVSLINLHKSNIYVLKLNLIILIDKITS